MGAGGRERERRTGFLRGLMELIVDGLVDERLLFYYE
jgi:hypothetical protein